MVSWITLNDLPNKVCFPHKNRRYDNRNKWVKILAKRISYECKCKFDGRKCILNRRWNNDKCQYECKNPREYNAQERKIIWNPTTCSCENVEYLTSTIDDSVIMCDEIVNAADSVSKNWSAIVVSTVFINWLLYSEHSFIATFCYHYKKT